MDIAVKNTFDGGSISAIASKSFAHRIIICASFADKKTTVHCASMSEDISATLNCTKALGADIKEVNGGFEITPAKNRDIEAHLPCGESGSTYRFIMPVAAAIGGSFAFELKGRLPDRPMHQLFSVLEENGISINAEDKSLVRMQGRLSVSSVTLPGNTSSQFITGMMLAFPLMAEKGIIKVTDGMQSKGYIEITAEVMRRFGIDVFVTEDEITVSSENGYVSKGDITVEGDWSNAAFPLTLAAVSKKEVVLENISYASSQGDKEIIDVLKSFGCKVDILKDSVKVNAGGLNAIDINCSDIPDLVPAIAAIAAVSCGRTNICGIERLKIKESDRIKTVSDTLNLLGASVTATDNSMTIVGKDKLSGGRINASGDHRIAMMAASLAPCCEKDVIIEDAQAVSKSYPAFFKDMEKLGLKSEIIKG